MASMVTSNLPPKAAKALTELTADVHQRGQYTDFVTNRTFRQSLMCHKQVKIDRNISPARMSGGFYASNMQLENLELHNNLDPEVEVGFVCANGRRLRAKNPGLKAMMFVLYEAWPKSLTAEEIRQLVEIKLQELTPPIIPEQGVVASMVTSNLIQLTTHGDVEFRFVPDRFCDSVSDYPCASPLARLQAKSAGMITTLRHGMLAMDAVSRLFVQAVDGTKDYDQLAEFVAELIAAGKVKVSFQGSGRMDMNAIHKTTVDRLLDQLRRTALLIS
ncbi:MAG: methyltransferase regulatory domain-containing protein [Pirellula sp.]